MASDARETFLKEIQAGFFGDFLISKGLVTQGQLREGLDLQATTMPHLRIGEILCDQGHLDPDQLIPLLQEYRAQLRLGELLISTGKLSFIQLLDCLDEQRKCREPLGAVVVRLGLCSQEHIDQALQLQAGLAGT